MGSLQPGCLHSLIFFIFMRSIWAVLRTGAAAGEIVPALTSCPAPRVDGIAAVVFVAFFLGSHDQYLEWMTS